MRRRTEVVLATALTLLVGRVEDAGATFYDFSWSGNSFSATGILELDDAIDVGEDFALGDVVSFELELFDGASSVASLSFPPFDPPFHTIEGTRNASSLSIDDLIVSGFAILFGCEAGDCLSGVVWFDTPATNDAQVDFGSTPAARASFVFTETPEPGATLASTMAVAALAALRRMRPRPLTPQEARCPPTRPPTCPASPPTCTTRTSAPRSTGSIAPSA